MPKIVDHDARKRRLAQATWRVIEREGVARASVRLIAQEAGVTPGQLRHYFSDHNELLVYAAGAIGERLRESVTAILQSEHSGVDRAQKLLEQLLPLDETRTLECKFWLGWLERTHFDQDLRAMLPTSWISVRYLCRLAYSSLRDLPTPQDISEVLPAQVHEEAAHRLHTYMDGLTLQAVAFPEHLTPDQARQQLSDFLRAM